MTDEAYEQRILEVKRRVEADLLRIPGVHGVSVGLKTVGGEMSRVPAITVHVERKRPLSEIPADERIPAEIDGIPTDVVEQPPMSAY